MRSLIEIDLVKNLCDPSGPPRGKLSAIGVRVRERQFDLMLRSRMSYLGFPDFETRSDCDERQNSMVARASLSAFASNLRSLQSCTLFHCGLSGACREACHYATLKRRIWAIETGLPLLEEHAGPLWAVTIVHPLWKAGVGSLHTVDIAAARQWNYRRLNRLKVSNLLAIGGFEVSPNRELDGSQHWAGEIQQIVAGATRDQLHAAFEIEKKHRDRHPNQKIVDVREFDSLPLKFAYGQKRLVQMRVAYTSATNHRQNRNKVPPPASLWAEFDGWLSQLPIGARIITYGCSRRGLTIYAAR